MPSVTSLSARKRVAKPGTFPHDPAPIPETWRGLHGTLDFCLSCVLGIQCSAFVFLKFFFFLFRNVCLFIRLCWGSGAALRILTEACEIFPYPTDPLVVACCHMWGLSCFKVCGVSVPCQEMEPESPALQGGFLATGPPGKSPILKSSVTLSLNLHLVMQSDGITAPVIGLRSWLS